MILAQFYYFLVYIVYWICVLQCHAHRIEKYFGHDDLSSTSKYYYSRRQLTDQESSIYYINDNGSNTVLSKPDITLARQRAYDVMDLIYQRYEYHNLHWLQFFHGSFNMPTTAWDLIKFKVAYKYMKGIDKQEKVQFLMIFGGSSVTAGHDNYFNQSYPMVFNRRMRPIFDALGIELVVRNIAQGANQCRPADFCYESMGGSNPDWIGWEQSYNCKGGDMLELMARIAMANHAIMFYTASGAFVVEDCDDSKDAVPWILEDWTPEKANITDKFIPHKEYISELRDKLNEWYEDGNAVARFTSTLQGKYDGVAPHGFSVWGSSKKMYHELNSTSTKSMNAIDMRPACYDKGGAHWMTKETASYGVAGNKRTFHPSIGMHMLRGEVLAYHYMAAVLDAMLMIEVDMKVYSPHENMKRYKKELQSLQTPGPDQPIHCVPEECYTKPRCWTNYLPHYNPEYYLDNIIVEQHDGWSLKMKSQGYSSQWGYLDYRPAYDSSGPNQEIHVKVDVHYNNAVIMVCGYFEKDSLKHVLYHLNLNTDVPNPNRRIPITNIDYRGDECYNLRGISKGNHVLTIVTDPQYPSHKASLSHIILLE